MLVLDTIGMTDLDYTGARALGEVLDAASASTSSSGSPGPATTSMPACNAAGSLARIGEDHCYSTVGEAVTALIGPGQTPAPTPTPANRSDPRTGARARCRR